MIAMIAGGAATVATFGAATIYLKRARESLTQARLLPDLTCARAARDAQARPPITKNARTGARSRR